MRDLRLLYAVDHLGAAGAQRQVVELAVALAREPEVHVSVLVYHALDFFEGRLRAGGVRVLRVPKRAKLDASLPWRLARAISGERPDLVHAFMVAPALWNLLSLRLLPPGRRPMFVAAERSGRVAASRADAILERLVYRSADRVTVNAAPMVGTLASVLGVRPERIHYLPNGIDLTAWDAARREPCPWKLEPGLFHIGLVGRLEPQKNHRLLIDALAHLGAERVAGWRVWCIGGATGSQAWAADLRASVEERGLARVLRFVEPTDRIAAVMEGLDVVVLPSLYEGFPNVLLEAMASGRACVATPVGDVGSLIEHGETGLLTPPGDAAGLARALTRLEQAPEERMRLGDRARRTVGARYAIETVARRYLDLYRETLG